MRWSAFVAPSYRTKGKNFRLILEITQFENWKAVFYLKDLQSRSMIRTLHTYIGQVDNAIVCGCSHKHRSFRREQEIRGISLWKHMPRHGKSEQFKRKNKHDFDTFHLSRQHGGKPGIGGTCGAKRGKSRQLGKWVTTVLLRVRERKKSLYFKTFFRG